MTNTTPTTTEYHVNVMDDTRAFRTIAAALDDLEVRGTRAARDTFSGTWDGWVGDIYAMTVDADRRIVSILSTDHYAARADGHGGVTVMHVDA